MASPALSGQSFIGSRISLISRAGIRYEGILYTIDATNSTVALSKVKSFGTEDRYSEHPIPPKDDIYEYIIFRGNDIQDLHVCEPPSGEMQLISQDPAIVEITGKRPPQQVFSRERKVQFSSLSHQDNHDSDYDEIDQQHWHSNNQGYNPRRQYYPFSPSYHGRGMSRMFYNGSKSSRNDYFYDGPFVHPRRGGRSSVSPRLEMMEQGPRPRRYTNQESNENRQRTRRISTSQGKKKRYAKDYDFESANAQIAKELERLTLKKTKSDAIDVSDLQGSVENGGEGDAKKFSSDTDKLHKSSSVDNGHPTNNQGDRDGNFYDHQRSFYDSISSEMTDRPKGKNGRQTNWRDEYRLNTETFGIPMRARRNSYYYEEPMRGNRMLIRASNYYNMRYNGYRRGYWR